MDLAKNSLLNLLGSEIPVSFLNTFEEKLYSDVQKHQKHVEEMFPDLEFQPSINGQLINVSVHQTLRLSALGCGLDSDIETTSPAGSEYTKVSSNSFVFTGIRSDSSQFTRAKYRQVFSKLNVGFNKVQLSLLEEHSVFANISEKIFVIFGVFVDRDKNVHMSCLIPNEGLTKILLQFSFNEIRAAAIKPANTDNLVPLVEVRRRLKDIDDGEAQAQG